MTLGVLHPGVIGASGHLGSKNKLDTGEVGAPVLTSSTKSHRCLGLRSAQVNRQVIKTKRVIRVLNIVFDLLRGIKIKVYMMFVRTNLLTN